jgi:hypothetical protein
MSELPKKKMVERDEADTVAGHTHGFSKVIEDTEQRFVDCSDYVGQYLELQADGAKVLYCWTAKDPDTNGPASGFTLVTGDTDGEFVAGCADYIPKGGWKHEVPKPAAPILVFKAAASPAQFSVFPK